MKFIYAIIVSIITLNCVFSIDSKTNNRMVILEKNYTQVLQINDSLRKANAEAIKIADHNEKLIERYDSINTTYSIWIFIILGVFGVAVPIAAFLLVVPSSKEHLKESKAELKESQKLLRNIENRLDKLFNRYTQKVRNKKIDLCLSKLLEGDLADWSNYLRVIENERIEGFNTSQIHTMILIAKKYNGKLAYSQITSQMLVALCSTQDEITLEFFLNELRRKKRTTYVSITYFAKYTGDKYFSEITDWILNEDNLAQLTINSTHEHLRAFLNDLYNYDKLVDNIDHSKLIGQFIKLIQHEPDVLSGPEFDLRKTKLHLKYKEILGH